MESKQWWKSTTIWGSIFLLASLVLTQFGIDFSPDEQAQAANAVVLAIDAIMGVVGIILTVIGRFKAKTKLTLRKPKEV